MSNDIERELRAALRPVDPGERFSERVLARIAREPTRSTRAPWLRRPAAGTYRWWGTGLAAMVILAVVAGHEVHVRRTEQGIEARRQLIEALRLTNEKLDLAYRAINTKDRPATADKSGA
jgi:negative regulator of sigma E activity